MTDFIDDDLMRKPEKQPTLKLGTMNPGPVLRPDPDGGEVPERSVSDINLTRMARRREEKEEQSLAARQELERLEQRQAELQRRREALEILQRKQEAFRRGKSRMEARLAKGVQTMQDDEKRARELAERLAAAQQRFKARLEDVQAMDAAQWPEERFEQELDAALTALEAVREEVDKTLAELQKLQRHARLRPAGPAGEASASSEPGLFGYWFRVGLAVSLPLIIVLVLLSLFQYLTLTGRL